VIRQRCYYVWRRSSLTVRAIIQAQCPRDTNQTFKMQALRKSRNVQYICAARTVPEKTRVRDRPARPLTLSVRRSLISLYPISNSPSLQKSLLLLTIVSVWVARALAIFGVVCFAAKITSTCRWCVLHIPDPPSLRT
jgi:hypothetical protein